MKKQECPPLIQVINGGHSCWGGRAISRLAIRRKLFPQLPNEKVALSALASHGTVDENWIIDQYLFFDILETEKAYKRVDCVHLP